jgi:uncharacterized OB-fold protein
MTDLHLMNLDSPELTAEGELDPHAFDTRCLRCGTVFPSYLALCPTCEEEMNGLPYEGAGGARRGSEPID